MSKTESYFPQNTAITAPFFSRRDRPGAERRAGVGRRLADAEEGAQRLGADKRMRGSQRDAGHPLRLVGDRGDEAGEAAPAVERRAAARASLQRRDDKLHTFVYVWCSIAGMAKLWLGKEEAVGWLRRSIETNGNDPMSHFWLAAALARLGRLSEARSEAQAGLAMNLTFTIARLRASAPSDSPVRMAGGGRLVDGLRKAGVPEQ